MQIWCMLHSEARGAAAFRIVILPGTVLVWVERSQDYNNVCRPFAAGRRRLFRHRMIRSEALRHLFRMEIMPERVRMSGS